MITAYVTVGIGAWTTHKLVSLIACPHVGDSIDVEGVTVMCDRVHITRKAVFIEQTIHFGSEKDAKEYFDGEA